VGEQSAAKYLSSCQSGRIQHVSFASPVSRNPTSDKNVSMSASSWRRALRKTLDVKETGSALDADEADAALEAIPWR